MDGVETNLTVEIILADLIAELSNEGLQLSFGATLEKTDHKLKKIMSGKYQPTTPLDVSTKEKAVAALQLVNSFLLRNATVELSFALLREQDTALNTLGLELSNTLETQFGISSQSFRSQVMSSVLGAGNDGSSHLVAALDVSWESMSTDTPLKDRVKKATRLVRPFMEGTPSWKIQLFDILLMLNINPYQLSEQKDSLLVTDQAAGVVALAKKLDEKYSRGKKNDFIDYPVILKQFMEELNLDADTVATSVSLCELFLTLSNNDYLTFINTTVNQPISEIQLALKDIFRRFSASQRANSSLAQIVLDSDQTKFRKAFSYVQAPAKLMAAVKEKQSDTSQRAAKCMLLNTESGYSDWINALVTTLGSLDNLSTK